MSTECTNTRPADAARRPSGVGDASVGACAAGHDPAVTTAVPPTQAVTIESELRSVDRDLLLALRGSDAAAVGDLTELLGVTATAVRQRVDRLLERGLIEREKVVAGRGRPTFRYRLTVAGHQRAGANPVELADAMWREIMEIDDTAIRDALLARVAARLGKQFAELSGLDDDAMSLEDRMHRLSDLLSQRQINLSVLTGAGAGAAEALPVLDVCSCPYPSLTDAASDRAMCKLEEKMFSEALGERVQLSSCRLDGDEACQFSAVETSPAARPSSAGPPDDASPENDSPRVARPNSAGNPQ